MDFITFLVVAAIIYGIVFNDNKSKRPNKPPQRFPTPSQRYPAPKRYPSPPQHYPSPSYPEPSAPYEVSSKTERVEKPPVQSSRDISSTKKDVLREAQGREGAWGDEGRPFPEHGSFEGQIDYDLISTTSIDSGDQTKPVSKTIGTLQKQDLVQAIVWAEILGKPRGLKPFNRQLIK